MRIWLLYVSVLYLQTPCITAFNREGNNRARWIIMRISGLWWVDDFPECLTAKEELAEIGSASTWCLSNMLFGIQKHSIKFLFPSTVSRSFLMSHLSHHASPPVSIDRSIAAPAEIPTTATNVTWSSCNNSCATWGRTRLNGSTQLRNICAGNVWKHAETCSAAREVLPAWKTLAKEADRQI